MKDKIAIVGAGKMGMAMLKALKIRFKNVAVYDRESDLQKELPLADIIIFAVKPRDFEEIKLDLPNKIVISIMAGISIQKIKKQSGAKKAVRSMPNLPLQVQSGLTAWIATKELDEEKESLRKIFKTFGDEIEVKKEDDLNKITALSGSGPAYFLYMTELLKEKAEEMGIPKKQAGKIARQTLIGTGKLIEYSDKSAKELKKAISSKGGTTGAALDVLENMEGTFKKAIDAAEKKSKELNAD